MKTNCMLAKTYNNEEPSDYWLSEKLDGMRAIWNGQSLVSRNDKPIHAPVWWLKKLPEMNIDGELFISQGMFQKTISVTRKLKPIDVEWEQIKYKVIDLPNRTFTLHGQEPGLDWIEQKDCELSVFYESVLVNKGEGLMLRKKNSPYVFNRSSFLLKLKPELNGQACIIDYQAGEGKHTGRLGALVCIWNGIQFKIGTGFSDQQRMNPPKIGSVIQFNYQCLTDSGVPRFPVYV